MLVRGMSAAAHGAEAVERGDPESGREISVRAAAGGAFAQREIHLLGKQLGPGEQSGAHFAFEGRPVKASREFKPSASLKCAQSMRAHFEAVHVANPKRT